MCRARSIHVFVLLVACLLCKQHSARNGGKRGKKNRDEGQADAQVVGNFPDGGRKEHPFRYVIGSRKRYESYDYESMTAKLTETIDPACGDVSNEGSNLPDFLSLQMYRPSQDMIEYWASVPPPLTMADVEICQDSPKFFERVGCTKGVALHPDSPRCHRERTKIVCDALASGYPLPMNETVESRIISEAMLKSSTPFILTVNGGGIVSTCGGVSLPCGSILTRTGCGSIKKEPELKTLRSCFEENGGGNSNANHQLEESSPCVKDLPRAQTVFVLSYMYDSAIGHFLSEVLPRVVYHLDILKQEHVKIHYGCDKKYKKFGPSLRFLEWLGLPQEKFIQGDVFATREILVPRDGACQDALWNKWEILKLRQHFLEKSGLSSRVNWRVSARSEWGMAGKPLMVIIQRSGGAKFSHNRGDVTRVWTDDLFNEIIQSMQITFPNLQVVSFSDRNITMMNCIECQVELFSKTSILVGMHGAGLSNMLFMPPESTVVEITAQNGFQISHSSLMCIFVFPFSIFFVDKVSVTIYNIFFHMFDSISDGRMLPGSGPFSRLAMATGINHYIHYLKSGDKTFTRKGGVKFNVLNMVTSIENALSKLKSAKYGTRT